MQNENEHDIEYDEENLSGDDAEYDTWTGLGDAPSKGKRRFVVFNFCTLTDQVCNQIF